MFVILDDTFIERHKFSDIGYLSESPYTDLVKIFTHPTLGDFRTILDKEIKFIGKHRSLVLFNNREEKIDAPKAIENFMLQVSDKKVLSIEFGRDMHTNYSQRSIDKNVFYQNFKFFLDDYLDKGKCNLKILYYGLNYNKQEKLELANKLMNKLYILDSNEYSTNSEVIEYVSLIFEEQTPKEVLENWDYNNLSLAEIIKLVNKKL